jgi:hypothetical protein
MIAVFAFAYISMYLAQSAADASMDMLREHMIYRE